MQNLKNLKIITYLFYFIATEQDPKDSTNIIRNKIWYRIKVLEEKILIISFVFELN